MIAAPPSSRRRLAPWLLAACLAAASGGSADAEPLADSLALVSLPSAWPLAPFPTLVVDAGLVGGERAIAMAAPLHPGLAASRTALADWPQALGIAADDLQRLVVSGWQLEQVLLLAGEASLADRAGQRAAFVARGYQPYDFFGRETWERGAFGDRDQSWNEAGDPFNRGAGDAAVVWSGEGRLLGSSDDEALSLALDTLAGEAPSLATIAPLAAALRSLETRDRFLRLLIDIPLFQRRADVPAPKPGESALPIYGFALLGETAADADSGPGLVLAIFYAEAELADQALDVVRRRTVLWEFAQAERYLPLDLEAARPQSLPLERSRALAGQLGATTEVVRQDLEASAAGPGAALVLLRLTFPAEPERAAAELQAAYFDAAFAALLEGDYRPLAIARE